MDLLSIALKQCRVLVSLVKLEVADHVVELVTWTRSYQENFSVDLGYARIQGL